MEINTCYRGDARDGLRAMIAADIKVQCCITSPPYWGLRDYGVAGQIGSEKTPGEFIETMVEVFALVRKVLADDGVLWLNLGDSYDKNKGLHGMPWRVAFALQSSGWILRQDIIWAKPNPMPESVKDRCTKSHEYIFMLTKNPRYYYDADAIKEPMKDSSKLRYQTAWDGNEVRGHPSGKQNNFSKLMGSDRAKEAAEIGFINKRSVWTVSSQSYTEAHFATFPEALIEPMVLASSRSGNIVLDPFMGSGTVAKVAQRFGRQWIGCELNPEYIKFQNNRTRETGFAFV